MVSLLVAFWMVLLKTEKPRFEIIEERQWEIVKKIIVLCALRSRHS